MSRTGLVRVFGSLALVFSLAGCATRQSIADIKYNPGRYQDRTVAVEGTVTRPWVVPLVPFSGNKGGRRYGRDDGRRETTAARRARGRASGSRAVSAIWRCSAASRLGLHLEQKDIDFKQR